MVRTTRLKMPLLAAGQAQKELTHNEALLLLDCIVHACCAGAPGNQPPISPQVGLTYICGDVPAEAWTGQANHLACWTEGGWRFVKPFDGLRLTEQGTAIGWHFHLGRWHCGIVSANEVQVEGLKVLGPRQPAIAPATGGTSVDAEARAVLGQVVAALQNHGLIAAA